MCEDDEIFLTNVFKHVFERFCLREIWMYVTLDLDVA